MPSSSHNRVFLASRSVKNRPYKTHSLAISKVAPIAVDLGTLRAPQLQQPQ